MLCEIAENKREEKTMTNSINKYLFYLSISLVVIFFCYIIVFSFFNEEPKYNLIIYEYTRSKDDIRQEYLEEIKDPKNLIGGYTFGVVDIPDKRINVSQTQLYVLVKRRSQEIMYVTDTLKKLNEYIMNELD